MQLNFSHRNIGNVHLAAERKPVRYMILAIFWIVIVLLGFEFYLHFFVFGEKPVPVYDPDWGRRYVAGSTLMLRTEGNGITHYVADGEIATPYQGGDNIPLLGDSQTEAYQVNDDQKFASVAEKKLREKGSMADLRNLGYSGGTLADYTYWAPLLQTKYHPNLVVIQISPQDFVSSEAYGLSAAGNRFTENADGTLKVVHQPIIANDNFLWKILVRFRGVSFLGYTQERLTLLFHNASNQVATENVETQPSTSESFYVDIEQSNYRAQLAALHTAYQGQRVIILVLPFSPKLSGDHILLEDKAYDLLLDQVRQYHDWRVVDPRNAFQNLWLEEHRLPRGFTNSTPGTGHLNVDGHAVVGKLLADTIEEMMR